jgi:hypothetical protein
MLLIVKFFLFFNCFLSDKYEYSKEVREKYWAKSSSVIYSLIGGVLATLLTGLLQNTPSMLVGAVHYGYPLAWLVRLVLAPEYFPWRVTVPNLVVDIVIWINVVWVPTVYEVAFPVLQDYRMSATIFLTVGETGSGKPGEDMGEED